MLEAKRLSFFSQNNKCDRVIELLNKTPNIDVAMKEGKCFHFAIGNKNVKMLNVFLEHYINIQIPRILSEHYSEDLLQNKEFIRETTEYKMAKHVLKNILEEAEAMYDFTSEIEEIITPYISIDESSEDEQDLSSFELDYKSFNESNDFYNTNEDMVVSGAEEITET